MDVVKEMEKIREAEKWAHEANQKGDTTLKSVVANLASAMAKESSSPKLIQVLESDYQKLLADVEKGMKNDLTVSVWREEYVNVTNQNRLLEDKNRELFADIATLKELRLEVAELEKSNTELEKRLLAVKDIPSANLTQAEVDFLRNRVTELETEVGGLQNQLAASEKDKEFWKNEYTKELEANNKIYEILMRR
jgi:hypothetical protein